MIKTFNRFARRVAAVDEKLIKECPKIDRIWATHIGYMLSATFIVLFVIAYLSIDYFNSTKVVFDIDTNMMRLEEGKWSIWSILAGVFFAWVVASIIFMFDRSVFQSDWFAQTPYGIPQSGWQSVERAIVKLFRIGVRLGISITIAYALSTFVELRIYESQIVEIMQKDHLTKNKKIYEQIKQKSIDIDNEIEQTRKERNLLRDRLDMLRNNSAPWMMDENIVKLDKQHDHTKTQYQKAIKELEKEKEVKLSRVQKKLDALNKQMEGIAGELEATIIKQRAEEYGIETMNLSGMHIQASGKRGDGVRSKMLKLRIAQLRKRVAEIDRKREKVKSELQQLDAEYTARIKSMRKEYQQTFNSYRQTKEHYIAQARERYKRHAKKQMEETEAALYKAETALLQLKKTRKERIDRFTKKMLSSPQFIPLRDGPLVRLMVLKRLSHQGEYADEMQWFSWVVKGFMIFLEVVPIVAKMFFSPPSVYAAMVQMQVQSKVADIFENKNTGSIAAIKEQIKLEKMRAKLNRLKSKRIITEALSPQKIHEYTKEKKTEADKEVA